MVVRYVQILGGSKTNNNDSKMAVFETKIQTKETRFTKAVEQKGLYFQELYQKSKENKEFWLFYTFILEK